MDEAEAVLEGRARYAVLAGDCRYQMLALPENCIDAVVTDPPYGLSKEPDIVEVLTHWLNLDDYIHNSAGFMGADWDSFVPGPETWRMVKRVMKPGAHLAAFGSTRTVDLLTIALRLAGFEIRDQIDWLYGNGLAKSMDIGKAFDKKAGATREVIGVRPGHESMIGEETHVLGSGWERPWMHDPEAVMRYHSLTAPATDEAKQWDGWGTALKPCRELIVIARKPLAKPTIIENVREYGTGALHVAAVRVPSGDKSRWPPNAVFSHLPECADECAPGCLVAQLDAQSGYSKSSAAPRHNTTMGYHGNSQDFTTTGYSDEGGASRFFPVFTSPFLYASKASRAEREMGCEDLPKRAAGRYDDDGYRETGERKSDHTAAAPVANTHPTVKPLALCAWLAKLLLPPGGVLLDPFAGSFSQGCAVLMAPELKEARFIGCELSDEFIEIGRHRLAAAIATSEVAPKPRRAAPRKDKPAKDVTPVTVDRKKRAATREKPVKPEPPPGPPFQPVTTLWAAL